MSWERTIYAVGELSDSVAGVPRGLLIKTITGESGSPEEKNICSVSGKGWIIGIASSTRGDLYGSGAIKVIVDSEKTFTARSGVKGTSTIALDLSAIGATAVGNSIDAPATINKPIRFNDGFTASLQLQIVSGYSIATSGTITYILDPSGGGNA